MSRYLLCILILVLLGTFSLYSQIPRTISYQGVLTDSLGDPKPDGSYDLVFRLYDADGTELWSEAKTLSTKRGLFSTILGDPTAFPDSLKFDKQYWLSIQVGANPELSPRIPLTSVGYSFSSVRADTASISLSSIGDTLWRKSGSNIYRMNGNVGIGTMSPDAKLDVYTPFPNVPLSLTQDAPHSLTPTMITMHDANGTIGQIGVLSSSGELGMTGNNSVSLRAGSGFGTLGVYVNTTGNVGIGTTSPGAKLDVYTPFPNVPLSLTQDAPHSLTPTMITMHDANGTVGQIGVLSSSGELGMTGNNSVSLRAGSGFGTLGVYVNTTGNVGIGTYQPNQALHIVGPVRWQNSSGSVIGELNFDTGADLLGIGSSLGGNNSAALGLWSGGIERLRIDQAGKVGIGTTNPDYKLDVNGDINLAPGSVYRIGGVPQTGSSKWTEGSGENVYRLNGNVGIGTASPTAKLHLSNISSSNNFGEGAIYISGINRYFDYYSGLLFRGTGDNWATRYTATNNLRDTGEVVGIYKKEATPGDAGLGIGPVAVFKNNGNVGIGTTSPTATLEVKTGGTTLADAWSVRSSRRWKSNIKPLEGALKKIEQLQGVNFDWTSDGKKDIGLIAEEVGAIVPEVVTYEDNGKDAKSVDYARLVALLIEGMKDQQKQIEELGAIVRSLQSK